jgi:hypothetical protein
MGAKVGDRIVVESERVGVPSREGAILEVVELPTGPHYRVRWDDGHESGFWPSAGSARIVPVEEAGKGGPSAGPDTGESQPVASR